MTQNKRIVHYPHDHLAEEDAIVHLLIHVRTVFLQRKFVVHILVKDSNHDHRFNHNSNGDHHNTQ